jgi:hypothetical protein
VLETSVDIVDPAVTVVTGDFAVVLRNSNKFGFISMDMVNGCGAGALLPISGMKFQSVIYIMNLEKYLC